MNRAQFLLILLQTTTDTVYVDDQSFKFTVKADLSITCTFKLNNLLITATIIDKHVKFDIDRSDIISHLSLKQFMANYPSLYLRFKKALKLYDQTILLEQLLLDDQLIITINLTDFAFIPILTLLYNDLYQCRFSTELYNYKAVIKYRLFNSTVTKITITNIGLYNPFQQLSASLFLLEHLLLYKQLCKAIILFQLIEAKQ